MEDIEHTKWLSFNDKFIKISKRAMPIIQLFWEVDPKGTMSCIEQEEFVSVRPNDCLSYPPRLQLLWAPAPQGLKAPVPSPPAPLSSPPPS